MSATTLEQLAGLEQICFPSPWSLLQLESSIMSTHSRTFLIEDAATGPYRLASLSKPAGTISGYALATILPADHTVELLRSAVLPEQHRRGQAQSLLTGLVRDCSQEIGAPFQILVEVSENNGAARSFYEQAGFAALHRRRNYYADGQDAIILRLPCPG